MILGTNMLVGGIIAFVLDNTLPGVFEPRALCIETKRNYCDRVIISKYFPTEALKVKIPFGPSSWAGGV